MGKQDKRTSKSQLNAPQSESEIHADGGNETIDTTGLEGAVGGAIDMEEMNTRGNQNYAFNQDDEEQNEEEEEVYTLHDLFPKDDPVSQAVSAFELERQELDEESIRINHSLSDEALVEFSESDKSDKNHITVIDIEHILRTYETSNCPALTSINDFLQKADKKFPVVVVTPSTPNIKELYDSWIKKIPSNIKTNKYVKFVKKDGAVTNGVLHFALTAESVMSLNVISDDNSLNASLIENIGLAKTNTACLGYLEAGKLNHTHSYNAMTQLNDKDFEKILSRTGRYRILNSVKLRDIKISLIKAFSVSMANSMKVSNSETLAKQFKMEVKRQQPVDGKTVLGKAHNLSPKFWEDLADTSYLIGNVSSAALKFLGALITLRIREPWAFIVPDVLAGTAKTGASLTSTVLKHNNTINSQNRKILAHFQKMYVTFLREGFSASDAMNCAFYDTCVESATMQMKFERLLKESVEKKRKALFFSGTPLIVLAVSALFAPIYKSIHNPETKPLGEYLSHENIMELVTTLFNATSRGFMIFVSMYGLYTDRASRQQARRIRDAAEEDNLDMFHINDKVKFYRGFFKEVSQEIQEEYNVVKQGSNRIRGELFGGFEKKKKDKDGVVFERRGMIYIDMDKLFVEGVKNSDDETIYNFHENVRELLADISTKYDVSILYDSTDKSPNHYKSRLEKLEVLLAEIYTRQRYINPVDLRDVRSETVNTPLARMDALLLENCKARNRYFSNFIYIGGNPDYIKLFRVHQSQSLPTVAISVGKQTTDKPSIVIDRTDNSTPSVNTEILPAHFAGTNLTEVLKFFNKSNEKSDFLSIDFLNKVSDGRSGIGVSSINAPANAINLSGLYAPKTSVNIIDLDSFGIGFNEGIYTQIKNNIEAVSSKKTQKKSFVQRIINRSDEIRENLFMLVVKDREAALQYIQKLKSEKNETIALLANRVNFITTEELFQGDLNVAISEAFSGGVYNNIRYFSDSPEKSSRFIHLGKLSSNTILGSEKNKFAFSKIEIDEKDKVASLTKLLASINEKPKKYDKAFDELMVRVSELRHLPRLTSAIKRTSGKLDKRFGDTVSEIIESAPQVTDIIFRMLTAATSAYAVYDPKKIPLTSSAGSLGATTSSVMNGFFKLLKERQEVREVCKDLVEKCLKESLKSGLSTDQSVKVANLMLLEHMPVIIDLLTGKGQGIFKSSVVEYFLGALSALLSGTGSAMLFKATELNSDDVVELFSKAFEYFGYKGSDYDDIPRKDLPFIRPEASNSTSLYASQIKEQFNEQGKDEGLFEDIAVFFIVGNALTALGQLAQFKYNQMNSKRLGIFVSKMKENINSEKFNEALNGHIGAVKANEQKSTMQEEHLLGETSSNVDHLENTTPDIESQPSTSRYSTRVTHGSISGHSRNDNSMIIPDETVVQIEAPPSLYSEEGNLNKAELPSPKVFATNVGPRYRASRNPFDLLTGPSNERNQHNQPGTSQGGQEAQGATLGEHSPERPTTSTAHEGARRKTKRGDNTTQGAKGQQGASRPKKGNNTKNGRTRGR